MPSLGRVTRINVLTAIRDHDLQGAVEFRKALGFDEASDEVLIERGKRYDARALLAYAHGKATGEFLGPEQISSGSLSVLNELEFTVGSWTQLDRAKIARPRAAASARAPRKAAAPTRARARPEPEVKLCPRCFMQLSVVGNCDNCD